VERFHPTARDWGGLVRIVDKAEKEDHEIRASGSHWALSKTAVTDGFQVETHDPKPDAATSQFSSLNETLYEVIPGCMSNRAKEFLLNQHLQPFDPAADPDHSCIYFYHVEAGTRIYELYCRLDEGDDDQPASLANLESGEFANYKGPWAMQTLGGAGGQTIVGALCTGTHGGDVGLPPIADAVQALHLIGVGGRQYWIEKPLADGVNLVDDDRLRQNYPGIEIVRDPDVFRSVIVAAGRMGIIYSVVLRVVRQFALSETRVESTWNDVKTWLTQPTHPVFGLPTGPANRQFVSVVLSPNAQADDKSQHTCFVTTRDLLPLGQAPYGRDKRCPLGPDKHRHGGNSYALDAHGSWYNAMCESDSPLHAAVSNLIRDLISIRKDFVIAAGVLSFLFPAAAAYAWAMAAATQIAIMELDGLRANLPQGPLGTTLAAITNWTAEHDKFEMLRRMNGIAFGTDQKPRQLAAISYAIMDIHDYRGDSCIPWGDSLEVFFNGSDPNVLTFVESLFNRIADLEPQRLGFGGYVAIRFMKKSDGLISMQKWDRTVSLEIAGMGEIKGTEPFLRDTERDAIGLGATVHWGQRNNLSMDEVEEMYDADGPNGTLYRWRKALSELTGNGRLAAFSTDFTRKRGLEVVQPQVQAFNVTPNYACAGSMTRITWYAVDNPPGTVADLVVDSADSPGPPTVVRLNSLEGSRDDIEVPAGGSKLSLIVAKELNGRTLTASAALPITGVLNHEVMSQDPPVTCVTIDGEPHWGAEVFFGDSFGQELLVEELYARFGSQPLSPVPVVCCRREGIEQLVFSRLVPRHAIPSKPILRGVWTFFVQEPGCAGTGPPLHVEFKLACSN